MVSKTFKSISTFSPTTNYKSNTDYELQYTRLLLNMLGIWPMVVDNPSKSSKLGSVLLILFTYIAILFVVVPIMMVMFIRIKGMRNRFIFIGPLGFRFSNALKLIALIFRSKLVKECIKRMKNDWLEVVIKEHQDAMLKSIDLGRNLTVICAVFMYSSGTFFHVGFPLLRPTKRNAFNVTIRPHLYPGYDFFVDSQATPTYELIFAAHCLCAASGYAIVTATSNLAAVFVSHIAGQVQVIRLKLESLQNKKQYDECDVNEQIASIVKSHVNIMCFSDDIKVILREICLVEVFLSTMVICWLEFYVMTEWANAETISLITYFLLLISLTFNIFIFCYIGQILKDQCESVGDMVYMLDWHRIPPKNVISLILIISLARYPRRITAGGLMELTIRSFGDVMKTSVAYLNMLRTVTI